MSQADIVTKSAKINCVTLVRFMNRFLSHIFLVGVYYF